MLSEYEQHDMAALIKINMFEWSSSPIKKVVQVVLLCNVWTEGEQTAWCLLDIFLLLWLCLRACASKSLIKQ